MQMREGQWDDTHTKAITRNAMHIEYSKELEQTLKEHGSGLQIQAEFKQEEEILNRYLNRPFGNPYDFDQQERVDNAKWM
jgi:hypothetical protein